MLIAVAVAVAGVIATTSGALPAQAAERPATPHAARCPHSVSILLDRLTAIDTELEGGMSFLKYKSLGVSAKAAYNRIPIPQLKADCLFDVGIPAEKAMNKFIAAQNTWRKCIVANANCKLALYNGPMQRFWTDAHRYLQKAINNLAD
jgi:hypothetical protein